MIRRILGVIVGYIVVAVFLFAGLSAAYMALTTEGTFATATFDVKPAWIAAWFIGHVIACMIAGLICKLISRSQGVVLVFALIVFVMGTAVAGFKTLNPSPPETRAGEVAVFDAMAKAHQPAWMMFLTPIISSAFIAFGGRLKKD